MDKLLLDAINSIPWATFASLAFAAVIFAIAKKYYDNLAAYWMFRSNKDLGKNVHVKINGEEGVISQVTWRFIYITIKSSGNELIIPITRWTIFRWEIYKNGEEPEE
ncbi:MAG: hypothetical protein ACTSX1_07950 [Candidatus Heimdallarchaeaceae archaeon]